MATSGSDKTACGGNCGCGGGDSESKDPYQTSLEAVWHNPTIYDAIEHGPEYMPKKATGLPTSDHKAEGRKIASHVMPAKTAADLIPKLPPLSAMLAVLRAVAFVHQTHHWQTSGGQFYSDHLLFERLYNESQPFIDQTAERAIGSTGPDSVDAHTQAVVMEALIGNLCNGSLNAEDMVRMSLRAESLVVQSVTATIKILETSDSLTNGTDNLLQGISDLHEGFVYLLKQRAIPEKEVVYHYGR